MRKGLKYQLIPQIAHLLHFATTATLSLKVENEDKLASIKEDGKSIIFAFWHGQLWLPAYHFRNRGYVGLASQSRDGEYITRALEKLGWEMVRGSTSKGGARSLLKLIRQIKKGKDIGITPDGPRGPRRQAQAGVIYLAQKTNSVIVPGGVAFSKEKIFDSWDKFQLPIPFSKAALVYGDTIEIDEDNLTDEKINYYTELLGKKINQSVKTAEEMIGDRS
ncbi:lysophospholipid acyltransferase family protein [Orenia marismortui]|uniref:DUF374 domain-containing protein n=1 Tax=Orenia marismortui TaxID=46469 RepID=A0A4R8HQD8_9FIRM|nr:lysophospholipid acyltransferase family protein [Orenia marismortui]TDX59211.1 hypothetical protein C7959_10198 [Orenia marismortui]